MHYRNTINIKKGDTLSLVCDYFVDDVLTSVDDFEIKASVKDSFENIIQNLTVEKTLNLGEFILFSNQTQNWPIDLFYCDIVFEFDDTVVTSSNFSICVLDRVTPA